MGRGQVGGGEVPGTGEPPGAGQVPGARQVQLEVSGPLPGDEELVPDKELGQPAGGLQVSLAEVLPAGGEVEGEERREESQAGREEEQAASFGEEQVLAQPPAQGLAVSLQVGDQLCVCRCVTAGVY